MKILCVDDSSIMGELYGELLEALNFDTEYVHFDSATKAIREVCEVKFNLMIVDFHMPEMDGASFVRQFKSKSLVNIDTPFVVATAANVPHIVDQFKGMGEYKVVSKPVNECTFEEILSLWVPKK
jgi:CheY-like chemotaxis protein